MTIVLVAGVVRSRRFLSPGGPLSRVLEPVAFAGYFDDVAVMRQPIEVRAGQAMASWLRRYASSHSV